MYLPGAAQLPMTEEITPQPEDPYGIAKYAVEQELSASKEMFGLNYIIFRPHNVYGEMQNIGDRYRNVVGIFMNQILQDKPLTIFGDGEQTRDFIYVDEVANSILDIMNNEKCREFEINVCSGKETSMKKIAELICDNFELDKKKYIEYQDARPGDVRRHLGDNKKLHNLFRKQNHLTIEDGLKETINWFKSLNYTPTELLEQEKERNWE